MKRRALLLAPLAMLGVKPSGLISRGSYRLKPGDAERFAAGVLSVPMPVAPYAAVTYMPIEPVEYRLTRSRLGRGFP